MNVLLVAHHFPPVGGAGVQRALGLVRHLPTSGWTPIVVTGPARKDDFWSPLDEALASEVDGVEVIRLPGRPPAPGRLRSVAERWMVAPDGFGDWYRRATLELVPALRGRTDVVLAELGPYGCAAAAVALAEALAVPLVLDLQDPWALDEMWLYPSGIQRRLDLRRMRAALGAAHTVVMNTAEAAERVRRAFPGLPGAVTSIPNGFEASDFAGPQPVGDPSRFRIVHTGSLHTRLGRELRHRRPLRALLGGMSDPLLDVLPRSHVFLLEAVRQLMARDIAFADAVEVVLAGPLTDDDRSVIAEGPPVVDALGFVGHDRTIELVRAADVLFLPMHAISPGRRAGLVPAKTYEYVASGRPILAAVPAGDARDLLQAAGTAVIVPPTDVAGMVDALEGLFRRWSLGDRGGSAPPEVAASYAYGSVAARVADVLAAARGQRTA